MKKILFDADGRLRSGAWILIFIALFLLSRALYRPVADGLRALGASDSWMQPVGVLFVLGVSWICLRLRRESLASVGLRADRRWLTDAASGLLAGCGSALFALALMFGAGAVQMQLDPARSVAALVAGLYLFACVALLEELLFRGFVFQRLVDGIGFGPAQIAMALLFALGHWGNPDLHGDVRWIATLEIALGAVLLGLAWHRTGSLALPFGLHLGWNWMQGQVLGFDVSGFSQAGWFTPVFADAPPWLSGGAFGMEASVCAIGADLVVIWLLWRWRGRRRAPATATLPRGMAPTATAAR